MQELWEACSHGYLLRAFDWQGRKNPQVPYWIKTQREAALEERMCWS
jgi:hypothetical protein